MIYEGKTGASISEVIYRSYYVTFRIFTKGYFGNTYLLEETIPYVNKEEMSIKAIKLATKSEL